ncbi:hypothetical protein [Desulfatibacillum aliphaticivorans]|uniref:hypothetical protein n=1 Tax=Desulfatibacillum aliphaticivorans TaxID=218208 RepID=UPI0004862996|nr:hypothetical protein [Desulfatibacillum aliphaticivorans]
MTNKIAATSMQLAIFPNTALGFISLPSKQYMVRYGRENREKKRLLPIGLLFPDYAGRISSFILDKKGLSACFSASP